MKKLNKAKWLCLLLISMLLTTGFFHPLIGQEDNCEKVRVNVYSKYVHDGSIDHLNKKYGNKSKEAWIDEIDEKMLEVLKNNSPEIDFFLARKNTGKDPHYAFRYWLFLISINTDILFPEDSITYTDPISGYEVTEYMDPVYKQETGFWFGADLVVISPCVPNRQNILLTRFMNTEDLELETGIVNLSRKFWRIINLIEESERRRPVPARGPELEISYEKEHLSLLTKEDRQMEVIAKVKNCKGEYLFMKGYDSQPVYFLKEVNRCKYEQVKGFWQVGTYNGSDIVLTNSTYEARGRYIVQNGIEASVEKVPLGSCGIGSSSEIHKDGELIIRGLEVNVKPDRREILVDEGTEIVITLNETDPDGNKYPVEGMELKVNYAGLVNGKIQPQGPYTTDKNGEVLLNYRAGDRDSRIDITASFQPPEYPDKAEDHSNITVNPMEYDATLFLKKKVVKRTVSHMEKSYQTAPCQNHDMDDLEFTETIEGSAYLTLKRVGSFDMFAYNQRWETYEISDIRISGFRFNSMEKKTIYHQSSGSNCAGSTLEQVEQRKKIRTNPELDQTRPGGTVVVAFDKDSDAAVLILPVGVSIGYTYDEIYDMIATITGEDGTSTRTDSDTKHQSDALNIEAVEDEQPYSQANSRPQQLQGSIESITGEDGEDFLELVPLVPESDQSSTQQKIHPDLIVQFGDGKTHFGGKGRKPIDKDIPYGYEHEEQTFSWQMTRKKTSK